MKEGILMSFKENSYQQISITDSFAGLTAREQKALEKSWAKVFADEIFPAIDETRFCVLYSDKASRPNTCKRQVLFHKFRHLIFHKKRQINFHTYLAFNTHEEFLRGLVFY